MKSPSIFKTSEHTVLLRWEDSSSEKVTAQIHFAKQLLQHTFPDELNDIVATYNELALYFKSSLTTARCMEMVAHTIRTMKVSAPTHPTRCVTIPVCYEGEGALDLAEVARYHRVSEEEVIRLHTQPVYRVAFIGFLPGFPYLEGLSKQLTTPRKTTPRPYVAAGSVGIGATQTGVYTQDSPGGWNIIGKSPLCFFSSEENPPSLLQAGDSIKFRAISEKEYEIFKIEMETGVYTLEIENI